MKKSQYPSTIIRSITFFLYVNRSSIIDIVSRYDLLIDNDMVDLVMVLFYSQGLNLVDEELSRKKCGPLLMNRWKSVKS